MNPIVVCFNCGKSVHRSPTKAQKNKTGCFFCCVACSNEHRVNHPEIYTKGKHFQRGYRRPESDGVTA